MEMIQRYMDAKNLNEDILLDRNGWRNIIYESDLTPFLVHVYYLKYLKKKI